MNVFHIVSIDAWDQAVTAGSYCPDSLAAEGFIHFSYAEQVAATANRYYRDVDGLQVLEAEPGRLGAPLRAELSPSTAEVFPHLYGPLPVGAVVAIHPLHRDEAGEFVFERV